MTEPPVDLTDVVILRCELLAEGNTDHQIRGLVRDGTLHRVRHGAYVSGALWESLSAVDRHRVQIRAVLRRAHPSTVVTHVSAAVERGAPVWGIALDEVHVTRSDGKPGRREAGVAHHCGELTPDDIEEINGIGISSAARCAVEVASMTTIEPALVTINGMLHARMLDRDTFTDMVSKLKHWPQTLITNVLLKLCDDKMESVAETRWAYLCWEQHLPRPVPQVKVFDEYGRLFARVDFAWPERGVFLEVDGKEKYQRYRRENETLEEFLMREKTREERICLLTGWICIRISWADLENPVRTARRIRRVLESRRPIGA